MRRFSKKPELAVKIHSFYEILYEGSAYSLSAKNRLGPLDILPGHANLLSILSDCDVSIDTDGGEKRISIEHGLLKVNENKVTLFVNI